MSKNTLKGPRTTEDFLSLVDEIAKLSTEKRKVEAERDAKLQKVQDAYTGFLEPINEDLKQKIAWAEEFAAINRDSLFPGKDKSASTQLARYGWRWGNPTLSLLNRKWKWDLVLEACRNSHPEVIETKESVNKDVIKATITDDKDLAAIGLRLSQSETFWVEPNLADAQRIKAAN